METSNVTHFDHAVIITRRICLDSLVNGSEFKGIGSLAFQLILAAASLASEEVMSVNADMVQKNRSTEKFTEMKERVQEEFVLDILQGQTGFHKACDRLVDGVFTYYRGLLK